MRRWISEPVLTGAIAMALFLAWMLFYSWQIANTGVAPSGGAYVSGWDFVIRMIGGLAVFALPVAIWVGLAIAGGYLVRRRGFGVRLLMAWCVAVVLCLPFAILAAVGLSASDGWRGLAVISLIVPVAAPFAVLPLYCAAAALLHLGRRGIMIQKSDA